MHILVITLRGPTNLNRRGGSQDYILQIAKRWITGGHRVTVVSGQEKLNGALLPQQEQVEGVAVHRTGTPRLRALSIIHAAKTYEPDADIVIENMMSFPLLLPMLLKRPHKLVAIRHHFEGWGFIKGQGLLKGGFGLIMEAVVQPLVYRNTPFVVVSKKTERELTHKWVAPRARLTLIPPGIDLDTSDLTSLPPRAEDPTILYLGALNISRKKPDHLIDAFRLVVEAVPGAKLLIGGSGPDKERLQKAAGGLPIRFLGFVSEQEKQRLFASEWLFASPSTSEGFGITWVEANAYGLPVVGYELGLDTVDHTCARMVAPGDITALAAALIELLSDHETRARMERAAYANAKRFDWDLSSARFLQFIQISSSSRGLH